MSQRAIIAATVEYLRQQLSLSPDECAETPDGQPTPAGGEWFYGVWDGSWTNTEDEYLDEYIGLTLTISGRVNRVPPDRVGPEFVSVPDTGLSDRCRWCVLHLHNNYPVMNAANAIIAQDGTGALGFVEPLRFREVGRRTPRRGSWWHGRPPKGQRVAGYSQTLTFARARRAQEPLNFQPAS